MYKNDKFSKKINIDAENGVYVFTCESASGKTYLCKELKKLREAGEPVVSFTFSDYINGLNLKEQVEKIKPKVIMLDRYDMYDKIFNNDIIEWGKNSIVLVDHKSPHFLNSVYTCCISFDPYEIEVRA